MTTSPLDVLRAYYDLVRGFSADPAAYAAVLHPEIEQTEYPNLMTRTVQHRTFPEVLDNLRLARELLSDLQFEVEHLEVLPSGIVVVEGRLQAIATRDIGSVLRGQRLLGQLCHVFEFKEGKIFRQRRYHCYTLD